MFFSAVSYQADRILKAFNDVEEIEIKVCRTIHNRQPFLFSSVYALQFPCAGGVCLLGEEWWEIVCVNGFAVTAGLTVIRHVRSAYLERSSYTHLSISIKRGNKLAVNFYGAMCT